MKKSAFVLLAVLLMAAIAVPAAVAQPADDPETPNLNEALIDHNTTFYVVDSGWGPTSSVTSDCADGWGDDDWQLTLTSPALLTVTVADCCIVGDFYAVYVDGEIIGITPEVELFGPTLSSGSASVVLGPGVHMIEIRNMLEGFGEPGSTGCPAGYTVTGQLAGFDSYSRCLNAGQDIEVGVVNIWNDPATLYVQYMTTEPGWMIAETHLAVADSVAGIPQTKKGNPIPGQFEYSMHHDPMVQQYTYEVPLGAWDACTIDELIIAAHAVVVDTSSTATMAVISDMDETVTRRRAGNDAGFTTPGTATVEAWEPGPAYPSDGPDDSAWEANSL